MKHSLLTLIITALNLLAVLAGTEPAGSELTRPGLTGQEPASPASGQVKSGTDFTQTISGTIVDAVTRFPLIGANVVLAESDPLVGTITDVNGEFILTGIPVGRQSLVISYVGYRHKMIPNILLVSGKQVVLEISLDEKAIEMDEVVVKAGRGGDPESKPFWSAGYYRGTGIHGE